MRTPLSSLVGSLALAVVLTGCAAFGGAARRVPLANPPRSVIAGEAAALEAAVDAARVVCVGELHDQRGHHDVQRDILERMQATGGRVMLGMEMFQRPYQQHLDDYVAGTIDEVEMLRRTEYYTRWKFDHTLYAPMWRFCRDHGLRIVALNPEASINTQVGRQGIASLSPEQRAGIAADVDLTDAAHRTRIMAVFEGGAHKMPPERLALLYEAMTVWDETMAESAVRALTDAGSGARMLVVAGSQHVQQWTGVPARIARRMPDVKPLVVVCRLHGMDDEGIAPGDLGDFVVSTLPNVVGEAPRLGVGLDDAMKITQVVPGGIAERAGLKVGYVLRRMALPSGALHEIRDLTDLKFALAESHLHGGSTVLQGDRDDGQTFVVTIDLRAQPAAAAPVAAR